MRAQYGSAQIVLRSAALDVQAQVFGHLLKLCLRRVAVRHFLSSDLRPDRPWDDHELSSFLPKVLGRFFSAGCSASAAICSSSVRSIILVCPAIAAACWCSVTSASCICSNVTM
jgi:hypothetical protein